MTVKIEILITGGSYQEMVSLSWCYQIYLPALEFR